MRDAEMVLQDELTAQGPVVGRGRDWGECKSAGFSQHSVMPLKKGYPGCVPWPGASVHPNGPISCTQQSTKDLKSGLVIFSY